MQLFNLTPMKFRDSFSSTPHSRISISPWSDSSSESNDQLSSPPTAHTQISVDSKTESYFQYRGEESPSRGRGTGSFDIISNLQKLTLTGCEEHTSHTPTPGSSRGRDSQDDKKRGVSDYGTSSESEDRAAQCESAVSNNQGEVGSLPPSSARPSDGPHTFLRPKMEKDRSLSVSDGTAGNISKSNLGEAEALRSEGDNRLDIPPADPPRRARRRAASFHASGGTVSHSRNCSSGLDQRQRFPEGADDDEHIALPQGTVGECRLEFGRPKGKKSVQSMLETMWSPVVEETLQPGFIYCFREKSAPEYVKIGYTTITENLEKHSDTGALPSPGEENQHVRDRFEDWKKKCWLDANLEFAVFMPCAVRRMESLIHSALHNEKRIIIRCAKGICRTTHREWFRVSVDEARAAVEEWCKFSRLRPYSQNGSAEKFWHDYVASKRKAFAHLNPRQWMTEHLGREISREAHQRRQRLEELEKQLERCRDETFECQIRQCQLELKDTKLRLAAAKHKEKRTEQELEALKKSGYYPGVVHDGRA